MNVTNHADASALVEHNYNCSPPRPCWISGT
jgi:hypothetical protein